MPADLPNHLDPWRAVKNGLSLTGEVALSQLPRLASVVLGGRDGSEARVSYELRFERDRDGRALVNGRVQSCLRLPCQRCLGEVGIAIDAPLRLGLINHDQVAGELPDDLDPLVITDERLDLLALIEDELLLAIPTVPRHDAGFCQPPEQAETGATSASPGNSLGPSREAPHPFAVLAGVRCQTSD